MQVAIQWTDKLTTKKPGLYANIHAKQERIKNGSDEKMRKPGKPGAPGSDAFKQSEKTESKIKKKPAKKSLVKSAPAKKAAAKKTTA
ncbi:MAG: hypothetical protein H7228_15005 [Polaromonas sp.]|nr:hypothetical protein [Polaromonas sp.]